MIQLKIVDFLSYRPRMQRSNGLHSVYDAVIEFQSDSNWFDARYIWQTKNMTHIKPFKMIEEQGTREGQKQKQPSINETKIQIKQQLQVATATTTTKKNKTGKESTYTS